VYLPRDISIIKENDIQGLVLARVAESAYLEFKRDLPLSDSSSRHEFLADVSAFANSSGGELLYGIDEDGEGQASAVVAQSGNPDEVARKFQDILLNGIEPRVPGLQVQPVSVKGGFVLVLRVPQSWAGPHRVKSNQHFFIRESGRKRQLDVPEIRDLFLRSENKAQRVRDFRSERLGKLMSGEAPHRLVAGALLIGHFVPTQSAFGTVQIDPIPYMRQRVLPILGETVPFSRINADGALAVRNARPDGTHGYSQLFRNGYFETVKVLPYGEGGSYAQLGSVAYEKHFIEVLRLLREEYIHLGIGTEITCMVSIFDADHVELGIDRHRYMLDDHQGYFDRKVLVLPDVLLYEDLTAALALKPVFDLIWQSAGMERSANYDADGNWAPRL
jgi:hypothetical protein